MGKNQTGCKRREVKMTLPYLTKYEKARILALRTLQITQGSALYIQRDWEEFQDMTALEIAEEELEQRTLPFKVTRFFSDKSYEEWSLDELKEVKNGQVWSSDTLFPLSLLLSLLMEYYKTIF